MRTQSNYAAAAALALLVGLTACGDTNDETDTGGADSGQTQDTGSADTGQPDTGQPDTGQPDTGSADEDAGDLPPEMAQFEYRRIEPSCQTGSCEFGVDVNVVSGQISKIQPGPDHTTRIDDDADIDKIMMTVVTDSVIDKMKNGWDCGDAAGDGEVAYEFEARIGRGLDAERKIQEVTGCAIDGATAADTAKVQEIRDLLESLGDKYLEQDD